MSITRLLLLLLIASSASGEANQLLARDNSGGWGSGGSVSSGAHFFDIALTALAFLSFGIFLLNLLLNALMFTSGIQPGLTATGPIITMTTPTTPDTGGGGAGTAYSTGYRRKRSTQEATFTIAPNVGAEVLATSALRSIKILLDGPEGHHCLPHLFCEGVRQGAVVGRGFQYLMPLYTLSSSYIGERLGLHSSLPSHLDAILVGVGGSTPCNSQFTRCPIGKSILPNLQNSSPSNRTSLGDSRSNGG